MKLLTDSQLVRRANRAKRNLDFAKTMAGCIKEELGAPVADDMVGSAISFAIIALGDLETIQAQLHIRKQITPEKKGGAS